MTVFGGRPASVQCDCRCRGKVEGSSWCFDRLRIDGHDKAH